LSFGHPVIADAIPGKVAEAPARPVGL